MGGAPRWDNSRLPLPTNKTPGEESKLREQNCSSNRTGGGLTTTAGARGGGIPGEAPCRGLREGVQKASGGGDELARTRRGYDRTGTGTHQRAGDCRPSPTQSVDPYCSRQLSLPAARAPWTASGPGKPALRTELPLLPLPPPPQPQPQPPLAAGVSRPSRTGTSRLSR